MLDGRTRPQPATVAGDANALASPIDTDGDGVADTLAVRVDAQRDSAMRRVGGWMMRSAVTLLLVAALVVAAAASSAYLQAQRELDRTTAQLDAERAAAQDARDEAATATARVAELEGAAVKSERDELAAENELLLGMLVDPERTAAR